MKIKKNLVLLGMMCAGKSTIGNLISKKLNIKFIDTDKVIEKEAKITSNYGSDMGKGGETFLRFNIATPRSRVIEAVKRMQNAFKDLQ